MDESSGVFCIGIWGMGGIGKTTIAEVLFNQLSPQFEGRCFLKSVKDISGEQDGFRSLREKLLSKLLGECISLETPRTQCDYIRSRLQRINFIIVLDDIDFKQFEILLRDLDAFGPGSRIIVTSRDKQVLINCGVEEDKIYQVTELAYVEALKLFSQHAFKKNFPPNDFLELSNAVLNYAKGNPLALKVLGSALQNKPSRYWEGTLNKLKKVSNYDMLDKEQKSIFLDIVCLFRGGYMDHIVEILAPCYHSVYCGIEDLIDKSLLTLSHNFLRAHDLVQEMGWQIVRDESSELGKRSRLWISEDVYHVLAENSGTDLIEGIFLDMSEVRMIELSPTVFSRMHRLRLLRFFNSGIEKEPKLRLPEQGLESLPSELRYLCWERYPSKSLPSNFNPQKLVEISMPHSNLEHLWDGPMELVNLKKINLSYSKVSSIINLLPGARFLTEVYLCGNPIQEIPASIGCLDQLKTLSLHECTALTDLPTAIRDLDSLERLFLSGCTSLTKFPQSPDNIRELLLDRTAIKEVPSSIGRLSKLVRLTMVNCHSLKSLPSSICKLKSLEWLFCQSCSNLQSFPEILEKMERLHYLDLSRTAIKSLPSSIENLIGLQTLCLEEAAVKEFPPSIENVAGHCALYLSNSINPAKLPCPFQLTSLEVLYLCNCPTLTKFLDNSEDSNLEALSSLPSLRFLFLWANNFERLPNLGQLSMLHALGIRSCKRLKSLPELPPSLKWLDAHNCTSLERVENFCFDWNGRYAFRFSNCFSLIQDASSDDIVANAYRNIQLMATAYVERFNHHHQVLSEKAAAFFCFPLSEIPTWFSIRNIGSSIDVKLPPGWQNGQFLGFVFCVVVEFLSVDFGDLYFGCYVKGTQVDGQYFQSPSFGDWKADQPISDHLLLLYDSGLMAKIVEGDEGDSNRQNSWIEVSCRFSFRVRGDPFTERAKVKECGVHLLYKNSTGDAVKTTSPPMNTGLVKSLSTDEEEEDPQSRNSIEETVSSEMHRNPDFGGQMVVYDANRVCNNDHYCYSGTESGANFGSFNAGHRDQESKFNLWNLVVRFLHVCDVRNCF